MPEWGKNSYGNNEDRKTIVSGFYWSDEMSYLCTIVLLLAFQKLLVTVDMQYILKILNIEAFLKYLKKLLISDDIR